MQTPTQAEPRAIRWTRDEYLHLYELGLFEGRRVQLLDGEIIEMPPMGPGHATALERTRDAFLPVIGSGYRLRQQVPLSVSESSDPEPDLAIVAGTADDFRNHHPATASLVLEISDTTLAFDQGRKLALYAAAGILDYWVLDITGRVLHVYRAPTVIAGAAGDPVATYAEHQVIDETGQVSPLVFPSRSLTVRDLLP